MGLALVAVRAEAIPGLEEGVGPAPMEPQRGERSLPISQFTLRSLSQSQFEKWFLVAGVAS